MTMKRSGPLPSLTGDAMLLGAALLWGVNVSVIALLLRHLGPLALSVSRMGTGTVLLVALTLTAEGSIVVCRRDLPLLLGAGLLTLADQLAFTYALKDINAATVSLLFGATPLFVMVLSVGFGWIALSWRHWTAAGLGLAGVAIIVTYGQRVSFHHLVGALLVVVASLSAAGYTLLLKPLAAKYSGQKVLAYVFVPGSLGGKRCDDHCGACTSGRRHQSVAPQPRRLDWGRAPARRGANASSRRHGL